MLDLVSERSTGSLPGTFRVPLHSIDFDPAALESAISDLDRPVVVVQCRNEIGVASLSDLVFGDGPSTDQTIAILHALNPRALGNPEFLSAHGVRYAYMAGAMANGIASDDLVIALGREGLLGSLGTAGQSLAAIEASIRRVQGSIPGVQFACNLIHSPDRIGQEDAQVDLYCRLGVEVVEASAFMALPASVVRYRALGLGQESVPRHSVFAKLSHPSIAEAFLSPPPDSMLRELVAARRITELQAKLASHLPVADRVTVEADSGGHTDRRPLVALLATVIGLRDRISRAQSYVLPPLVGAAGGLGDPAAIAAAFSMGADYVVTGSVGQACVESGTSAKVKAMLAAADLSDVAMAPAADMFEMGVQVQVLKKPTMFAARASRLYRLYTGYESIEFLPESEIRWLERDLFRASCGEIWRQVCDYHTQLREDVSHVDPHRKLGLMFRWYLGMSSRWAIQGAADREIDYQVWCGPAMGAFNAWTKNTPLAEPANRLAATVAGALMTGAAHVLRRESLRQQGIRTVDRIESPQRDAEPSQKISELSEINIETWLVERLAKHLDISEDDVDIDEPFASYEIDSIGAMSILSGLEKWLNRRLSPTLIYNYSTIRALAKRLAEPE